MLPSFLAQAVTNPVPVTAIVNTLDGVTTVLVAFVFLCLYKPTMVKNRSQFYAALAAIAGIVVVHTLMLMFDTSATMLTLGGVGVGVLQLIGLLMLVLCVGGLTAKELAGEMANAYEVMRRGETTKETIIPIGGEMGAARPTRAKAGPPPAKVYKIDEDDEDGGIPLS